MKLSPVLVLLLGVQLAHADEVDPKQAAAQRYLELANTLKSQGKLADACAQLEIAFKAVASGAMLSELSTCYRALTAQLVAAKQDSSTVCSRIVSDASVTPSKETRTAVAACHTARADALLDVKDFTPACEAAEAAVAADGTATSLVFAAGCHRDAGKLGRAWRRLLDAKTKLATAPDSEVDRLVVELLSAMRPGRVIVEIPVDATVQIDGAPITRQGISIAGSAPDKDVQGTIGYPLDAGAHKLTVIASDKPPVEKAITIVDGNLERVSIELEKPTPPSPPPQTLTPKSARRQAGWITIAASGVVGAAGLYFGYDALSKQGDANDLCPTRDNCSSEARDLNDKAGRAANISNALVGVAVVGAAVGTVLILTAPKETRISVSASPTGGGVTLSRRF